MIKTPSIPDARRTEIDALCGVSNLARAWLSSTILLGERLPFMRDIHETMLRIDFGVAASGYAVERALRKLSILGFAEGIGTCDLWRTQSALNVLASIRHHNVLVNITNTDNLEDPSEFIVRAKILRDWAGFDTPVHDPQHAWRSATENFKHSLKGAMDAAKKLSDLVGHEDYGNLIGIPEPEFLGASHQHVDAFQGSNPFKTQCLYLDNLTR